MQTVFEKIIEELEKLDVKAIKRYKGGTFGDYEGTDYYIKKSDAIEIVKQEAEQYTSTEHINCSSDSSTNGWVPCSERLPETYTVLCCDKYGEMLVGHPYFDEVSNTNYSAESDNEMMYNCIAWQPLPEPYKTKGD